MSESTENKKEVSPVEIGNICNYYGGLNVKSDDGKYYWAIEDHSGYEWEEITEKLYNTLIEFEKRGVDSVFIKHGSGELLPEPAEGFIWKWKGIDDEGVKYKLVKS